MGISFTPQQQKVIDLRDCNILVSAAAGSGKTAVLVERIVAMVCNPENPVDIDRLLIVTFTRAAAQEMRERIREALEQRLSEDPENEYLERQMTLLHNSLITTIDSFCLYIVKNHFNEVGLDPALRICDEGEEKLLSEEVMQELLEDAYRELTPEFEACVEYFCQGKSDLELEENIRKLYTFSQSHPFPLQWLRYQQEHFAGEEEGVFLNSPLGKFFGDYLQGILQSLCEILKEGILICREADGPYLYEDVLKAEWEELSLCLQEEDLREQLQKISAFAYGKFSGKRDDRIDPKKRDHVKALHDEMKGMLRSLQGILAEKPLPETLAFWKKTKGPMNELIELTIQYSERLLAHKKEKKQFGFSDIAHFALDILLRQDENGTVYPSETAREYAAFFQEILVDEYQDSNLVQEYLLQAVSGEEDGRFNRFMVGDIKQSIYRFRLARPELFLEKYRQYQTGEGQKVRIDLSKNFRSRKEVLDAVNTLFVRLMNTQTGGIVYDEEAALYLGADYPEAEGMQAELLLLEEAGGDPGEDPHRTEGRMIARRIKALKKDLQVTDKKTGQLRPCAYRDMVILLRSNDKWDEPIRDALEQEGIPAVITARSGYFETEEIGWIMALLQVLDNPLQDIPLFGVLTSVFGGFSEEDLVRIKTAEEQEEENCLLWEKLNRYARREDPLAGRVNAFVQKIGQWRAKSIYMPVRELLEEIFRETMLLPYVTALPGGGKRQINVEMLLEKASAYEKTSFRGLFHFVRYLKLMKKYEIDMEGDEEDADADVVRIMSIHKSKGLEFPICFVAGMGKKFNVTDLNKRILMDMDCGLGTDHVDAEKRLKKKTIGRQLLNQKLRQELLAEELRLLYVAMTRAKEKLILTGMVKHVEKLLEERSRRIVTQLNYLDFIKASSYLDFVLPVCDERYLSIRPVSIEELHGEETEELLKEGVGRKRVLNWKTRYDSDTWKLLKERFSYQYPHENLKELYTKTSVSELKAAAMEEADEEAHQLFEQRERTGYVPEFVEKKEKFQGTERGNAYHKAMECMDFAMVYGPAGEAESYAAFLDAFSEQEVKERTAQLMNRRVYEGKLPEEYREVLSMEKLMHFLRTELSYRMHRAQKRGELYREQPFVYSIAASRLSADFPAEEKVLIQGIVDAFFIEEGGIVILDYKTDRVRTLKELRDRYEAQLLYYEEAVGNLMHLPVKEKILYSFSLEKEYPIA